MKVRTMVGLYRMLFGGRNMWVTGLALVVFSCAGYLALNLANFAGVVDAPPVGNWAVVIGFMTIVVLVACVMNGLAARARDN